VFADNRVHIGKKTMPFPDFIKLAYGSASRCRRPAISPAESALRSVTMRGRPFFYFAYGAAVSEVLIDALTGEYKVERVDVLHESASRSIRPSTWPDRGRLHPGHGLADREELYWDAKAGFRPTPFNYKIPTCSDLPRQFNVRIAEWSRNREDVVYRSKAVGEPPLMLAISVFHAIKDAIAAVANIR